MKEFRKNDATFRKEIPREIPGNYGHRLKSLGHIVGPDGNSGTLFGIPVMHMIGQFKSQFGSAQQVATSEH
jgi:hypothetical protein